jgi:Ca2+-binding RTX toxin-like protein
MATFKYGRGNLPSVLTTTNLADAFTSDSPAADTLIVDAGAYLIATGSSARGAVLANTGAWKVTVNGTIFSKQETGIELGAGNLGVSTISIGAEGSVGGAVGIAAYSSANIVNAGTIAGGSFGIFYFNEGVRTITNKGVISGFFAIQDFDGKSTDKVTNSGTLNGDVELSGGNDTLINSKTINGDVDLGADKDTLTNSGTITGEVQLGAGDDKLVNSGKLSDDVQGGGGDNNVTNSGTIAGIVSLLGVGNNTLKNTGSIGAFVDLGNGNDTFTNSGSISQDVFLNGGDNKFTNSGTIGGEVTAGTGADTVTNSKTIAGDVNLGDGINKLTNSGTITGNVTSGTGNDTITNSKTIGGDVTLGNGTNALINSGTIVGAVTGGAGVDAVKNTGTIAGLMDLGDDNDSFTGGGKAETVRSGNGADIVKLGGGNDIYIATGNSGTDGADIIDGGLGVDTYDASAAASALEINLDKVAHNLSPFVLSTTTAKNTATGTDVAGSFTDTITGFENARGGSGNDRLYGTAAANVLEGNGGVDHIYGFAGNDILAGGAGADFVIGGAGKDVLTGGANADKFGYQFTSESGTTKATRDVITDFQDTVDKIDLFNIDANTTQVGDQAFNYINGNSSTTPAAEFTGAAGQLRSYITATGVIIEGDVNGDKKADFSIELIDPTHAITLTSTAGVDFIL